MQLPTLSSSTNVGSYLFNEGEDLRETEWDDAWVLRDAHHGVSLAA